MEDLVVEEICKNKSEKFIKLIKKMFKDSRINEEKAKEILEEIYK